MNKKLGSSRIGKRLAVALGVALAASTVAVPSSGAAKISAAAKNDLLIMINEPDAGWCNQDSPGIDQVAAKNSVLETLTIMKTRARSYRISSRHTRRAQTSSRGRSSSARESSSMTAKN